MKKKIIIITILIIVVLLGGIAYAYFATDLFKTDKEMFFSYITEEKLETEFNSEKLIEYYEKQETTPYESDGKISIDTTGTEELEGMNGTTITFEGKTNNPQKAFEQKATLDLAQGYSVPVNIKRDGETFGIQADILGEDKYIAIRNEDLKELVERFGIDTEYIPEKIEFNTFTKDELKQLVEKYYQFLHEELTDDMFTREKKDNQTIIKLNIPMENFVEIFSELIKTIREDEIITSKFPDDFKESLEDLEQNLQEQIEEESYQKENSFEVAVYIAKGKTEKIEINLLKDDEEYMKMVAEFEKDTISIEGYKEEDIAFEQNISIQMDADDLTYSINTTSYDSTGEEEAKIDIELTYKNLMQLDNVQEEFNIDMTQKNEATYPNYYYYYNTNEPEESTINIQYSNQKTFSQDLELNAMDENNAIIINDATDEELQNLVYSIYQSLDLM